MFRRFRAIASVMALALASGTAMAQTPIKFSLNFKPDGSNAAFFLALERGYYKEAGLDVTLDTSGGTVDVLTRLATNAYDLGFADIGAVIEFAARNPGQAPISTLVMYDRSPLAVVSLKKSGISKPADLMGKKLGAPVFDAGRKSFPIFAKANGIDLAKINWTAMDPPLRETMLVRGDIDAITGFYFTSLLNLNARGVKDEDIVVLPYPQFGVKLYGNVVIVAEDFLKKNPEAVKAFLRAFTKGVKDVIADPAAGVASVKDRDALIDTALETRRLKLALAGSVVTPDAKAEGFGDINGPRMALMASQVNDAFGLKERIQPDRLFVTGLLPAKDQRNIFAK
jgi:NitT/TauT family transport system substrate-binding protein